MRELEVTGERPAQVAGPQERITIEKWRDQFVKNARTENISSETIRKYEALFRQLIAYTQNKGLRFPSRTGPRVLAGVPKYVEGQAAVEIEETRTPPGNLQVRSLRASGSRKAPPRIWAKSRWSAHSSFRSPRMK